MNVLIPGALKSYTGASRVTAAGDTLAAVLFDLDRRYPGLRFRIIDEQDRIRPHMRIFVGDEQLRALSHPVNGRDEVVIVQALSGG